MSTGAGSGWSSTPATCPAISTKTPPPATRPPSLSVRRLWRGAARPPYRGRSPATVGRSADGDRRPRTAAHTRPGRTFCVARCTRRRSGDTPASVAPGTDTRAGSRPSTARSPRPARTAGAVTVKSRAAAAACGSRCATIRCQPAVPTRADEAADSAAAVPSDVSGCPRDRPCDSRYSSAVMSWPQTCQPSAASRRPHSWHVTPPSSRSRIP